MLLIMGPAYQGKLAWVRSELAFPKDEIVFCSPDQPSCDWTAPVVSGLHLYCRAALAAGLDPVDELTGQMVRLRDKILLCDEIGSGIVPLSAEDRRWREAVGRVLQLLAGEAENVLSFTCGIPFPLKGSIPESKTIYLLRHGLSEAGKRHLYSGWSDFPLCEEGRGLLDGLSYPKADAYYSSPNTRAVETLFRLYGNVDYRVLPGLRECSFGSYEGFSFEELKDFPDYQAWISDITGDKAPPDGESRNQHGRRVMEAFTDILGDPFQTAAVICHGGTIVQIMDSLFSGQKNFYEWQPECGHGWLLHFVGGQAVSRRAV